MRHLLVAKIMSNQQSSESALRWQTCRRQQLELLASTCRQVSSQHSPLLEASTAAFPDIAAGTSAERAATASGRMALAASICIAGVMSRRPAYTQPLMQE